MRYKIVYTSGAEKDIGKLPRDIARIIKKKVDQLSHSPFPTQAKKLKGYNGYYRLRVRVYRIIYKVEDMNLLIIIVKVGHRQGIYKKL